MTLLTTLSRDMAGIVTDVNHAIVQVKNGGDSGGAGVIWQSDGLIITNAHVVLPSLKRQRTPTVVLADGTRYASQIVKLDQAHDLAALAIDANGLDAAMIGDSQQLQAGDWVTAIGHPWGVKGAVTGGSVIAVGRPPQIRYDGDMVQANLHMRPGHSGGAMVDDEGQVIGINCMNAGPDVGLAIPSNTVSNFLRETKVM